MAVTSRCRLKIQWPVNNPVTSLLAFLTKASKSRDMLSAWLSMMSYDCDTQRGTPYSSESRSATVYHETTNTWWELVWGKEMDCSLSQGVCILVGLNPTVGKDADKHYIRSHCVFGLCPSTSVLRKHKKHNVSETRSVSILGWRGGRCLLCLFRYKVLTLISGQPISVELQLYR
jgi:hypothetical protein